MALNSQLQALPTRPSCTTAKNSCPKPSRRMNLTFRTALCAIQDMCHPSALWKPPAELHHPNAGENPNQ
eukprot:3217680-Alexandrium_andersonii.AAC.1